MTAPDFNVLLAVSNSPDTADRLEQEAEALEAKAHALRVEAMQLRACARTLGRFG